MQYRAVCFGEVLWDNLPSGKKLGGAPLNVSYHLNRLGVPAAMITRIGQDQNGVEIEAVCEQLNVPTLLFQKDAERATSTVEVHIGADKEVKYEIVFPVAWDFIEVTEQAKKAVSEAEFFVFGSLSSRNEPSYNTLMEVLDIAKYKVFDINLREPFYTKERVLELLCRADLVKMNKDELATISAWTDVSPGGQMDMVSMLMEQFDLKEVILTHGVEGGFYYSRFDNAMYPYSAYKVEVNDTIGSGDSFLAGFVASRLKGVGIQESLAIASVLAGFVTASEGACPAYQESDLHFLQ